ncbi:COX15/CtaA family protein [Tessaracoccus caeni]|uniref:COX15/CtaA family protein n=1 Tax=Tessaracoccus caeni TaxID=3031239 RepID=UPI0023DBEA0C|nr:COX15/CtaA family protein [Tessaracoccus caeni]MDF1489503.1 COX15/CtaA family protein [Tessaracoccus caeni]
MDFLTKLVTGQRAMRAWLWASLICNMGIIVTGAVVRLTGSGLGCPTWPKCTDESYVPHPELGLHGVIEFGNRTLTFVLMIAALGAFIAVWRTVGRGKLWALTLGIGLGIPFQGVIGGFTVWSQLNPFVVALHLLLSVALVVLCVWALFLGYDARPTPVARLPRLAAQVTFALTMLSIWIGTVVTGSGPHAGDADAPRTGFEIEFVARLHSLSAWAAVAGTVACLVLFRAYRGTLARRSTWWLLAAMLLQGLIGYIQYFAGLPLGVVILHMIGLPIVAAAAAAVLFSSTRSASEGIS